MIQEPLNIYLNFHIQLCRGTYDPPTFVQNGIVTTLSEDVEKKAYLHLTHIKAHRVRAEKRTKNVTSSSNFC